MLHNILTRVSFTELDLDDPSKLIRWAAVALFASELPTADLAKPPYSHIRPMVRATVWQLTELERSQLVNSEYGAYPEEAAARMTACVAAVADAPSWPLMSHWLVAK